MHHPSSSALAQFKVVISDSAGKSISQELKDKAANPLLGLKIGDVVDSNIASINGKMQITGGSDKSGTPMRPDLHGGVKKYILLAQGVGMRNRTPGIRIRKLIRGNMVTEEIYQLNSKLLEGKLPEKSAAEQSVDKVSQS
ncbi:MAG TPA: S6e family ribosomal protein [Nitrososphaeraceae archaeon]|nr:S6e family ribosomal protein [Nitrososphaeraceae archaeon]